jgi:probable rRNA maturation factor
MKRLRLTGTDVSLALISDADMRRLNRKYRRIDLPTDVLSFTQDFHLPSGRRLLGDILIAAPTARRQAREAGHPLEDEASMLAVHGLLHLLGHDHERPGEARMMFGLQERLLRRGKKG